MLYTLMLGCRTLALLFLCMLPIFRASGQAVTPVLGDEYGFSEEYKFAGILALPSGGYLQMGFKLDKRQCSVGIQRLNDKSQVEKEATTDYAGELTHNAHALINWGDKVYWIYSLEEKSAEVIYAREVDPVSCKLIGEPFSIGQSGWYLRYYESFPSPQISISNVLQFAFSPDRSKMLIWANYCPTTRNEAIAGRVALYVYDTKFKRLWSRNIMFANEHIRVINRPFVINNEGEVFTSLGNYAKTQRLYDDIPDYFDVYKFTAAGNDIKLPLRIPGKFVADALVGNGNDGNIYVGGCYAKTRDDEPSGFFLFFMDKSDSLKKKAINNLYDYEKLNVNENHRRVWVSMRMSRVQQDDDGNVYVFGEENSFQAVGSYNCKGQLEGRAYDFVSTNRVNSSEGMNPGLRYQDIVVACIKPDGNLKWMNGASKKQQGLTAPGGLSFSSAIFKDKCYLFYMDNIRNFNNKLGDDANLQVDGTRSYLTAVIIDENGSATKQTVLTPDDYKYTLQMYRPLINEGGAVALFGFKLKEKLYKTIMMNLRIITLNLN